MQRFVPPLSQSTVALTPVAQVSQLVGQVPQLVGQVPQLVGQVVSPQLVQSSVVVAPQLVSSGVVKQQMQPVLGQSRLEHIPYQRKVVDYEQQVSTTIVPKERLVQDYYTIEHQVSYIPNVIQEPYVDYVPVQRYKQRVEYNAVESSRAITQPNYNPQQGQISTVYTGAKYSGQAGYTQQQAGYAGYQNNQAGQQASYIGQQVGNAAYAYGNAYDGQQAVYGGVYNSAYVTPGYGQQYYQR
ncbi:hypothetical protein IMG5_016570 [Ichthyophthirius multifiliis]|uniref:Uncharacterized protein n=1 Tax=Ichthyophthirius multifiliis TaxID=5932 RepID=G0QKE3_ICHMU|nr:hypothetical protein IMG5_016570 [Ichthyophthirius multifiliis]EGR34317.1 hypothetical protein IMG5_016570 [Ichthyophthirius multifiliis]|eukprot:XP_004039621.1 hypothetical protein IMG5_016570 [Ichthyophthirius multifiliis]